MAKLPAEIDDDEIRTLFNKLSSHKRISAVVRAFNQTLQTLGSDARKRLRAIGVTARAAKVKFGDRTMRGGMLIRNRVSIKQIQRDGTFPVVELLIRQGVRANVARWGATPIYEKGRMIGVKAKLNKVIKFRKAFLIRNRAFWREKDGKPFDAEKYKHLSPEAQKAQRKRSNIKPIMTPSNKHYEESKELIEYLAQSEPGRAETIMRKRVKENLNFLLSKQEPFKK